MENVALYLSRFKISGRGRFALLVVLSTWKCREPCQLRLDSWARVLGCSRRAAIVALKEIEAARWVTVDRRGFHSSNLYSPSGRLLHILRWDERRDA